MSTREQTPTPAAAVEDAPATATIWNKVGYWLPHLVALAYCLVILMAISTQFTGAHDMPCPLCTLQRMAMILIGIGAVWMVGLTRKGRMNMGAYARGYGLMILGALLGMIISTRQVLLHIEPDDPGYGGTVLGLHFYTWALITFLIVLVYSGVMLTLTRRTYPVAPTGKGALMLSSVIVYFFVFVIALNVVLIFIEQGFNWVLPDDPSRYELLYQLGIK
ncbi:MAG: disulfide bond formation protein B [Candidatus Nanopelagicales bacterium]|nr:disulfide bond formation protein B [Candidatus Nanopelagicales bacterium]